MNIIILQHIIGTCWKYHGVVALIHAFEMDAYEVLFTS